MGDNGLFALCFGDNIARNLWSEGDRQMKFGLLYEHQLPRPWDENAEHQLFHEALAQCELADRLGIDYIWEVEHHFLEEYAHSSAPEVFLAACAARTKGIRLGHGVVLAPPGYNHPARVAERIATLDLVSSGRVDWGTGESASRVELEGFGINPEQKKAMWAEAVEETANMMAMDPYPGFEGKFFSMPCRNIVPKPVQRPHPPLWVACSKRETIHAAARAGIGALTFAFVDPGEAGKWAKEYYEIVKSDQCVPIGHAVNANIAMVTGFSYHADAAEAKRRGGEGFQFFGYSLGHYYVYGQHKPGRTNVWERFETARPGLPEVGHGSGIGTPAELTQHLRRYQDAGVDQVIFIQQGGRNRHAHICAALELFASAVMPALKEGEAAREAQKARELEPYVTRALARKRRRAPLADADIPVVGAYGNTIIQAGQPTSGPTHHIHSDITVMMTDPADKEKARAAGED
jgi:alkanesulfonate monooxygenase SsuD/methylene tetrahydromethanopterin reductase-like flavin-dependent oxidoreductase (luciferase family)